MIKTLQNALKVKEIRSRLLFTLFMIMVVRFGSQLPIPGTSDTFFKDFFSSSSGEAFNFFNSITGGSLDNLSVFALSITPYITSSIIMQLLTIAIPRLEEIQHDGEEGRKKIAEITRYVTVALALVEAIAITYGFRGKGIFTNETWYTAIATVLTLTAGSAFLMWVGERITEKGIGNGISVVLLINILSGIPQDALAVYEKFIQGKSIAVGVLALVIILAILVAIFAFTVLLNAGVRKIPVQYAQKMQGRRAVGGQSSHIPLKVNTAGVIPVIFASSILSTPVLIANLFGVMPNTSTFGGKVLMVMSSNYWFNANYPWASIGVLVYIGMLILFAYFYTSITFNPMEIADNMKKQGGFIPGIRPGKSTSEYLNKILNYMVFIGAVGLIIVALIPMILSGVFSINRISFLGTSLIIIISVILETLSQIESKMVAREYDSIF